MNIETKRIMKVTNFKDMYHYDLEGETIVFGEHIPLKRHIEIDVDENGLKKVSRIYSGYEDGKYNDLTVINHFRDDNGDLSMYEEHFMLQGDKFVKVTEDDRIKSFIIDEDRVIATKVKTDSMESEEMEFTDPRELLETGETAPLKFNAKIWTDPASVENGFKKTVIESDFTTANVTKMSSVKTIDGKTINTYTEDETVYLSKEEYTEETAKYVTKYKPAYFTSTTTKVLDDEKLNDMSVEIDEVNVIEKITHMISFNKKTPIANASTTVKNNVLFIDGVNQFGNDTTLDIIAKNSAIMKAIKCDVDPAIGIDLEALTKDPMAELAKLGYIVVVSTEVEKHNYDEVLYSEASDEKFVSFDVDCYDKDHNHTLSISITTSASTIVCDRVEFNEYGIKTLLFRQAMNKKI